MSQQPSTGKLDFETIKQAASGRWGDILAALTPLSGDVLRRGKSDHPCPVCNGTSVIWPSMDAEQTGSIACRTCTGNKPSGDGIATVAKWAGLSQGDAAKAIGSYLGIGITSTETVELDVIQLVCRDKRMPLEAFKQFGPTIEKRGRERQPVARVPVYNELGEQSTYFDLAPKQKGWFAKGKGVGLFMPGRMPTPGETWLLPEGCKDSAALVGLGYNAAGLPTSQMADKYAQLFAGCHVILVPDLDSAGQLGAQVTGGRLAGIAASVRVARLPGEVLAKGGDDVRDVLARADGERLVRTAIADAEPWQPREGEHDATDGKPEVLVSLAYGWVCDQVTQCLGRLGWESPWIPARKREALKLFQRGGALVHVVVQDDAEQLAGIELAEGTARIRPLPAGQLPLRIADACQLIQEVEKEGETLRKVVPPQRWLIDGVFTRGDWGRDVRRLEGVIAAPTIRRDGSILQAAGYDEKTGLLHVPSCKFPTVPNTPTLADAQRAAAELLAVVKDFPFVDDADRSAWLALVLSLIGRSAVAGCVPMFTVTATCRGSGKTLLADAASLITFGRHAARKAYSPDDAEQRKAITATAMEALPIVLLDNVDCSLGGPSLDAALTAMTWTDRLLGTNRTTGELPLRTVWMGTGNNLRFGSDLARRVLPIRLAPEVENPEERTDFEHCDLLSWVRDNRPRLAIAALTILRAYFVAGRPVQAGGVWGSYEAWSSVIRGAVVWAGLADPLATRATAKADDTSGAIVRGLLGGLIELDDSDTGLTVREIVAAMNAAEDNQFTAMREVVAEVATTRGAIDARRLTYVFRKYKGRIANGFQITGESSHGGVIRWRAKRCGEDGDHGDHNSRYPAYETGVSHTNTCDTQKAYGEGLEVSSSSSPWSPVKCKCGSSMVAAEPVRGWRNWDCPSCGAVQPIREVTV